MGFFFLFLNCRFDEFADEKIDKGMMIVMRDVTNKKLVNKVQDINHDSIFRCYIENKNILDIVKNFTGDNIMAVHSMLIAKPPDAGTSSSRSVITRSKIKKKKVD